jgi:hypothetical protein
MHDTTIKKCKKITLNSLDKRKVYVDELVTCKMESVSKQNTIFVEDITVPTHFILS